MATAAGDEAPAGAWRAQAESRIQAAPAGRSTSLRRGIGALALGALAGCAANEAEEVLRAPPEEEHPWYCEMNEEGDWRCEREAGQAAAPRPRLKPTSSVPLYKRLAHRTDQPVALTELPSSYYAVQVLAVSSLERLRSFVGENNLYEMAGATVENNGRIMYVLLAGVYEDRASAVRAAESLPQELGATPPWIRPMASLQAAIRRAEALDEAREP